MPLVFFSILSTTSANTITIGTGTSINTGNSYPAPYGNFYEGAKHQYLITAAELNAAGMTAGNINSLSFNVAQINGSALQGFTIAMKNTLSSSVSVFETGLTTVLIPQTYTEMLGLNTHVFTTSFLWDGISNLLIETCFNNTSWTQNAITYFSNTSFPSTIYYRADQAGVCLSNSITASANSRPNMVFDWTGASIAPTSNFIANATFTCSGVISFTDLSSNNPTSWNWDFGDNNNSTSQNPIHTYTSNGTYNVTLITCNTFGCDTITFNNYITVNTTAPSPVAPACAPSTLSYCCGFGITNVTFNTINNSSSDGVGGYSDFTCTQTTVLEGQTYPLAVQSSAASTQNYAVWIDFNNDGNFNDATERVFTASSQVNTTGNVTIPAGAVLNTPLRLRVSADYDFSAPPIPCANLDYGQAEDYTVIIMSNPNPPTPVFSATPTETCSGVVCFADLSLNVPTGWLWEFGDGSTSFQQSPCHTYTVDGTYTVTLTVTNVNGGNVDSIVNYVTVNTAGQVMAASCSPATTAYCCGYGIYQVDFNTISNSTIDGIDGYQDFSCTEATTVTEGDNYTLIVKTGLNNAQDSRAWIDFNNDGIFNNTNELVMDEANSFNPAVNVLIPAGAVLNTTLRMRVSSDVVGVVQSSCDANDFGQTEDYGIVIQPNAIPPMNNFSASTTTTCADTVQFTDLSSGAPTSWMWYFGDGATSVAQNPSHYYTNTGYYTVSLVTSNAFGQDSVAFINYIEINCFNVSVPISGTSYLSSCFGALYDNGGEFSNYSNNTDGIIVIQPPGATSVSLNFMMFDFVASNPGDTLFIYDGPSELSPLIGFFVGNAMPGIINSTGGSITLRQKTDNMITDPGFELTWSCNVGVDELQNFPFNFLVYPNPARHILNIKALEKNTMVKSMEIYNTIGEAFMNLNPIQNEQVITLDISSLAKGLYFLNITTDKGIVVKKVTIF